MVEEDQLWMRRGRWKMANQDVARMWVAKVKRWDEIKRARQGSDEQGCTVIV